MGVCDSIKIPIPGTEAPRIDVPKDKVTLSKMAYGYSVELSPLQLVTCYNAIANDGRMVQPMLVKRRSGRAVQDGDDALAYIQSDSVERSADGTARCGVGQ